MATSSAVAPRNGWRPRADGRCVCCPCRTLYRCMMRRPVWQAVVFSCRRRGVLWAGCGWRLMTDRSRHTFEDMVSGSESHHSSGVDDQRHIQCRQDICPVRYHNRNFLGGPQCEDGAGQCFLAIDIEIGVRLVQYDQKWGAEHGAREPNPLLLARGHRGAALTDLSLVSVREAQNHFMSTRNMGGLDDRSRGCASVKACDVLRDGSVEQRNILR